MKTQTLVDTGFVSGDPPLNTPVYFSFSITPSGVCTVTCKELGVSATGPSQPDIIPNEGFAMDAFSMFVAATQESSTSAQPLQVPITQVLVTGQYQLVTSSSRTTNVLQSKQYTAPPSDIALPQTMQQKMQTFIH